MSDSLRPEAPRLAVLVAVQSPDRSDAAVERSLSELENLLRGLAIEVHARLVQKRQHPTSTYLGEGKLRELARLTGGSGEVTRVPKTGPSDPPTPGALGLVVVDDELTPGQQRSLEQATGAEVLDRTGVILRVFESRARTREAMLEVELARLAYELPRIREDVSLGDRDLADIRDQVKVLDESYAERLTVILRGRPEILDRFRRKLAEATSSPQYTEPEEPMSTSTTPDRDDTTGRSAPDAHEVTTAQIGRLAARHGLDVDVMHINEAGLDYRVAFARAADGTDWILRVPRRPDVSAKLTEERRILDFIGPRLSVAVPNWEVCSDELVAYRRLPGEPGLTLDASGQPVWHFDPSSPDFATALGRLVAELQAIDIEAASEAGVPVVSASEVRARWRADLANVSAEFEIAPPLRKRWEAWLGNDALWPERTAFTHGELYAAHVLIDGPARILGVLDWTTAKVGDPAVDFSYQHMMGPAAFEATVAAFIEAGGVPLPHLGERCAELVAASPVVYGIFALKSGDPRHRATAAALLLPEE